MLRHEGDWGGSFARWAGDAGLKGPTGRTGRRSQPSPRFFPVGYTRLEAAMRSSRLPAVKRLADFDFTFQPSLRREQIDSLPELDFLRRKENVVFLGPPGVGKTHLAISLAIRAAERGRRVYYGSLRDLVGSLQEAETKGQLRRRLRVLTHPALLVVDEIAYLPVTRNGATLFFQFVNERLTAGRAPTRPSSPGGGFSLTRLVSRAPRRSRRSRGFCHRLLTQVAELLLVSVPTAQILDIDLLARPAIRVGMPLVRFSILDGVIGAVSANAATAHCGTTLDRG